MSAQTKNAKCPWPKPQMREVVRRAIDNVGGPRGFAFMGRGMQEAIIDQACWHIVCNTMQFAKGPGPSFDEMIATRRMSHEIAGIWDDDD